MEPIELLALSNLASLYFLAVLHSKVEKISHALAASSQTRDAWEVKEPSVIAKINAGDINGAIKLHKIISVVSFSEAEKAIKRYLALNPTARS